MKLFALVFSTLTWGLFSLALAQIGGQQTETFRVRNIKSEAESLTSEDASKIARRNANLIGLREVFSRIVPAEHRARIRVPSDDQLALMVLSNFDRDTRSGLKTFRLVTDLEFDKAAVLSYLESAGIPFADEPPQRLMVVPQLIDPTGVSSVFEENNDWMDAWQRRVWPNSVEWVLPEESEANAQRLGTSLIEFRFVEEVLAAQGEAGAYIARVTQVMNADGIVDGVQLQALKVGSARGPARVEARFSFEDVKTSTSPTLDDLYNLAASALTDAVTDEWLASAVVSETNAATINIVVLGVPVDEWFTLANAIERNPLVDIAEYIQSRQGALDVRVEFRGGLQDLQQLFIQNGYMFEAYSLVSQPTDVGFLLQPDRLRLPGGITIHDLGLIRLNQ